MTSMSQPFNRARALVTKAPAATESAMSGAVDRPDADFLGDPLNARDAGRRRPGLVVLETGPGGRQRRLE